MPTTENFNHHAAVQLTRLLAYGRIITRRCIGSFSNCIQALCSHLQWQDTKLHACGGCCPAAVTGYQTACTRGCPAAVSGYQTAYMSKGRANMQQQQPNRLCYGVQRTANTKYYNGLAACTGITRTHSLHKNHKSSQLAQESRELTACTRITRAHSLHEMYPEYPEFPEIL
jgi:hypothetical protein